MFYNLSGLKVSWAKSKIFFSPNTPKGFKNDISNLLDIIATENFGSYLGFPLHTSSRTNSFSAIIDKFNAKLNGWKTRFLNLVRKIVFIKIFFESLPTHIMQCASIPKKVYK